MPSQRLRTTTVAITGFLIGTTFSSLVALAWTGPTGTAPSNNVSAPLNTSTTNQVKNGGLSVNTFTVFGNSLFSGFGVSGGAGRYLNFDYTQAGTSGTGSTGYGIRDNAGTLEFKNLGGAWNNLTTIITNILSLGAVNEIKFGLTSTATCTASAEGTVRYNATSKVMEFCNGSVWNAIGAGVGAGTSFTVSSNTNNVNLYVLAGSPATAGNYTITINAGVTIGSANTATASVVSGSWPAGSTVTLINKGNIYGRGGDGGSGQNSVACGTGGVSSCPSGSAGAGAAGGPAISLSYNLTLDNSTGSIFGGGGGGGGAASGSCWANGGSGGQGSVNSAGGAGGSGPVTANAGNPGTVAGPGVSQTANAPGNYCTFAGGAGGAWASTGSTGGGGGAGGGAAGKAIVLNGKSVTWLGGNDATHVKGTVQ